MKLSEYIFCMQADLIKHSLIWFTFTLLEWPQEKFITPPTAFWKCVIFGMCIWDTVMAKIMHANRLQWFLIYEHKK